MRIALGIEYDGSRYFGWQRQREVISVQEELEKALSHQHEHPELGRLGQVLLELKMISAERLAAYPRDTLFVVYCAGPHCNGANKAAVKLAALGYPVKEMIGGVTGWLDEGFKLSVAVQPPATAPIGCEC